VVPWAEPGTAAEPEPAHELSHAFTIRNTWPNTVPKPRSNAHKAIVWGEFGDGRKRVDTLTEASVATSGSQTDGSSHTGSVVEERIGPLSTQHTLVNGQSSTGQSTENVSSTPGSPSHASIRRSVSSADKSGAMVRQGGRGGLTGTVDEDPVARAQREADKARLRRAHAYGFSNYQPEAGW